MTKPLTYAYTCPSGTQQDDVVKGEFVVTLRMHTARSCMHLV